MKKKKQEPRIYMGTFGRVQIIDDFLPPPEQLVFKKEPETVKVTLTLEKNSVDYFKKEAKRLGGSYQRMMRNLLQEYADKLQA